MRIGDARVRGSRACLVVSAFFLVPIAACGDDDSGSSADGGSSSSSGGGDGAFDSALQDDMAVSSITIDQARDLCIAATEYLNETYSSGNLTQLACTTVGLVAGSPEQCRDLVEMCTSEGGPGEQPPMFEQDPDESCSDITIGEVTDCDATVGEIEACFTAARKVLDDLLNSISCDQAGNNEALANLATMGDPTESTPECMALEEKCELVTE